MNIDDFDETHTCSDERMAKWVSEHVTESDFGFGVGHFCGCQFDEEAYGEAIDNGEKYEDLTDDCWAYHLYSDEEIWEEWMSEINQEHIAIYLCKSCGNWAIDDELI